MPAVHYPFMFDFKQPISGNGFLAGVKISGGRALMLQEGDQWWMYGVFPATISESGTTANECFLRYMEELKSVLYSFAADAGSYEEFHDQVTSFLGQTSPDADLWKAAQEKLKAGTVATESGEKFIESLPKESPDRRLMAGEITRLDQTTVLNVQVQFTAADNIEYTPAMAA